MKHSILVFMMGLIVSWGLGSLAQTEDYVEYDSIVNSLKSRDRLSKETDPFDEIQVHFGLGVANSYVNFRDSKLIGKSSSLFNGFQVSLGVDLFSKAWMAEGSVRTYEATSVARKSIRLQEFGLAAIYHTNIISIWHFRLGLGIIGRTIQIQDKIKNSTLQKNSPASQALGGIYGQVSSWLTMGADLAYVSPLVRDSADGSGAEFMLRADTHF